MPVNLTAAALATAMRVGTTTEELTEVTRLLDVGTDAVERHLGPLCYDRADTSAVNEAAIRLAAYLYDMPNAGRGDRHTDPIRYSGAGRILSPFLVHRGAAVAEGPDAALTFTAAGGVEDAALAWTFATADDAMGSTAVYKWQYNVDGGRWQDIPGGATVRSYAATGLAGGRYPVGIRGVNADAWGAPAYAEVFVTQEPDAALTFTATGESGMAVLEWTFSTDEKAAGSSPVILWQYNIDGGAWQDIPGGGAVRIYTATLAAAVYLFGLRAVNTELPGVAVYASATVE